MVDDNARTLMFVVSRFEKREKAYLIWKLSIWCTSSDTLHTLQSVKALNIEPPLPCGCIANKATFSLLSEWQLLYSRYQ